MARLRPLRLPAVSSSRVVPDMQHNQAHVHTAFSPPTATNTPAAAEPSSAATENVQIGPHYGKSESTLGSHVTSWKSESGPFYNHAGSSPSNETDKSRFLGY